MTSAWSSSSSEGGLGLGCRAGVWPAGLLGAGGAACVGKWSGER